MQSKKRNPKRFPVELENRILKLYQQHQNMGVVERETGLFKTSISRVLKRNGVDVKANKSGKDHPGWKGGINQNKGDGYRGIWQPGHERADGGGYVYEHTLNFEKANGFLPKTGEVLHHIDLDKKNNSAENLYLCNHKKHIQIHRQVEKLIKPLMDKGIIYFKDGQYFLS